MIRLTPVEREAWGFATRLAGKTMADWIRDLADQATCRSGGHDEAAPPTGRSSGEYERGVKIAADVVAQYDSSTTHPHRLGDCVLHKLNLRKNKPRRNARRLEDPRHAWLRGFATALAEVYRLLANGNEATGIRAIARAACVTLADLRAAKAHPRDVGALKLAGVPSRRPKSASPGGTR